MRRILFIVLLSLSVGGSKLVVSSNPPVPGAPSPPHAAGTTKVAADLRQPVLRVSPNTYVSGELVQMTTDGDNQTETAVIRSTTSLGLDVTTTAFMTWLPSGSTVIRTVAKWPTGQSPQEPDRAGLSDSGDPWLAIDPYRSPSRTYLSGIRYPNDRSYSKLTLWRSEDGGQTWMTGKNVKDGQLTGTFYDKPSIAVSWNGISLGHVYVVALIPSSSSFVLFTSTDGGDSFQESAPFSAGSSVQGPVVAIDHSTQSDPTKPQPVYIFFADWGSSTIRVLKRTDTGGLQEVDALSLGAGALGSHTSCDGSGNCITTPTMIAVRYNAIAHSFGVTWHQRGTGGDLDVKLATFTGSNPAGSQWSTPRPVGTDTTRDQWHAALDWDNAGDYLITYYDRRDDTNNELRYRVSATKVPTPGPMEDFNVTSREPSIGTSLQFVSQHSVHTMGEYHDVWFGNDQWTVSYIYAPQGSTADVYFSYIKTANADPGQSFYLVTPCRLIDTRLPDGPYGGPAVPNDGTRVIQATGACGIPSTAKALALNVVAVQGPADGTFTLYPTDAPRPSMWTLRYRSGMVRANNATVPLSQSGQLSVYNINGAGATNLIVDVTGYFQ